VLSQVLLADDDLDRCEAAGIGASQTSLARIRHGFSRMLLVGQPFSAQAELLNHLAPTLARTMAVSHLMGERRSMLSIPADAKPVFELDRFSEVMREIRRAGLGKKLNRLQRGYARRVYDSMRHMGSDIDAKTRGVIASLIADKQPQGRAMKVLQATLNKLGVGDQSQSRLEAIYTTESAIAYHAGRWQHDQKDPRVWGYRYITMRDDRVRPEHAALEGTTLPKKALFWQRYWPPNGWNSVPPDTLVTTDEGKKPIAEIKHGDYVLTHKGRFRPVYELHRYKGPDELVTVQVDTVNSATLSLTGNHQVFTQRGWVDAACLDMSDKIACPVERLALNLNSLNVNDVLDFWVANKRSVSSFIRSHLMALGFDTYTQFRQPEIDPIALKMFVEMESDIFHSESTGKQGFTFRHFYNRVRVLLWEILKGFKFGSSHFGSDFRPSRGRVDFQGVGSLLSAFGIQNIGNDLGVTAIPHFAIGELKNSSQRSKLNASGFSNIGQSTFFGPVVEQHLSSAARPRFVNFDDGTHSVGQGTVGLSVVDVRHSTIVPMGWFAIKALGKRQWDKQEVYNLAVDEDDSYVAEGMAIHNCRCQIQTMYGKSKIVHPGKLNGRVPKPDEGFSKNFGELLGGDGIADTVEFSRQ